MSANGSDAGQRPESDPGPLSGVLPLDEFEPPTPRALPIGPRSAVPAGRKGLARREKKSKKLPRAARPADEFVSPLADTGPWANPKEAPPLSTEASDPRQLVRPYTRTGGRTHVDFRLELETLLSTPHGRDRDIVTLRDDYRTICEMCRMPQSTAEIAVRLGLPLGAARVLIADVVTAELLFVHETATEDGPSMDLLYRVAAGLRKL
ncbi:DUF742 domain-containing protein [Actinophytocola oryzae]|uniref:Uncharacterized protein DUF742 n=1 Tax=Actinophytocola oryzae TaxID=502181 RepID=A0A4R7VQQ7_9PSEU|nr:DUF742 domain-containing protein [Actinophytocola oryzae]TDV52090.1 uncharacterized protein DUF742 [Actinophytocola oryzae]